MFSDLFAAVETLTSRTAKFRRVVLHMHSPDSHDWGRGGDAALNGREQFLGEGGIEAFCALLRPHVDCACVTDHMKCGFSSRLSQHSLTNPALVVLPGMEVNLVPEAALGIHHVHLLVILPEGSPASLFERLFTGLPHISDDPQRNGHEKIEGISLKEWVTRVHGEGGICVAAHVDNSQGIRRLFRQTGQETMVLSPEDDADVGAGRDLGEAFKEYLFESRIDAIEVRRSKDSPHYRWVSMHENEYRSIATVLTFDAHCVEGFRRPDRVTHIKMTGVGLEGLKQAFAFPDTRIRFPDTIPQDPPRRLVAIEIEGTGPSFFQSLRIAFAENLSCIIGARGSGKSTVIESLRFILGYNRSLEQLGELARTVREMQRANLTGSRIRVVYRTSNGAQRILQASFDPKEDYTTLVHDADGHPV